MNAHRSYNSIVSRDPVTEEASARAYQALANHQGVLRSLTDAELRAATAEPAGPAQEIGITPPQWR